MTTRVSPFSKKAEASSVTKVTTANKLDNTNTCPVCGYGMPVVMANGYKAHYCQQDRVCLPVKD